MEERYRVKIVGICGMIMHADDVRAADALAKMRADLKSGGRKSVAGDDRSPSITWQSYLYRDDDRKHVVLPTTNLQSCLMTGGSMFALAGSGRKGKTLKSATMSVLRFEEQFWPLYPSAKLSPIKCADVDAITDPDFEAHEAAAEKLGIMLDVRRATVGQPKHVRVRPRFAAGWWASGTIVNTAPELVPLDALRQLLEYCGSMVGLGDWRPSSPKKPGPHGKFVAEISKVK